MLLNTNEIKAVKKMVFGVCRALMGVQKVSPPIPGYSLVKIFQGSSRIFEDLHEDLFEDLC